MQKSTRVSFALRVTISQATRDKLERARALMRHRNPSGDIAEVLDRALDALLTKLEKEKFAATSRPRAKGARPEGADPRYVQNAVKREVSADADTEVRVESLGSASVTAPTAQEPLPGFRCSDGAFDWPALSSWAS